MRTAVVRRPARGFTLVELLVGVALVAVLATFAVMGFARILERARCVRCMGQMRQIGVALASRAQDSNGRFYSREDIGNSSYRAWGDPLSLCQVLEPFLNSKDVWMSPGAPKRLHRHENSYAWSRANVITEQPQMSIANPSRTVLLWNNHTFTLPSVNGVPEGSTGGPRNASRAYYHFPWQGGSALNWLYVDGHVETW
jgi:prepilin-type N-terminal cleavage/methylation domain-containing protein/prepilin-type processing-associated H-X9-DG protein